MRILTAHKILIGTAVAFFLFYAGWELVRYVRGDTWAALRSAVALAVAAGLGAYLGYLFRRGALPGPAPRPHDVPGPR